MYKLFVKVSVVCFCTGMPSMHAPYAHCARCRCFTSDLVSQHERGLSLICGDPFGCSCTKALPAWDCFTPRDASQVNIGSSEERSRAVVFDEELATLHARQSGASHRILGLKRAYNASMMRWCLGLAKSQPCLASIGGPTMSPPSDIHLVKRAVCENNSQKSHVTFALFSRSCKALSGVTTGTVRLP